MLAGAVIQGASPSAEVPAYLSPLGLWWVLVASHSDSGFLED